MICASQPCLPPAVYAAARKPDQFADAGVFYSWIVSVPRPPRHVKGPTRLRSNLRARVVLR